MKFKATLLVLSISTLLISYAGTKSTDTLQDKKGMIKVTIMYPNGDGNTFDMDYYMNKHMPMLAGLLKPMKFYKIDKGIGGRTPDEPVPFLAIGYLYFDKLSDYHESFGANAQKILGDIPNYTNAQPLLQISEVVE
ncbi:EthD family reductase [Roseivirga sp. E12]|uniref:EthD family reductase n=1 Tax=Roseivirga sp. E12 TaxID=2819237 RepID=UPI001ABC1588|nr:EthD family reductase [Roseivirga sp. E12]MBO3697663.1 EthD family reductase [Roseivirga sp. E12]